MYLHIVLQAVLAAADQAFQDITMVRETLVFQIS